VVIKTSNVLSGSPGGLLSIVAAMFTRLVLFQGNLLGNTQWLRCRQV
jgi:hypothetical protein